MRKLIQKQVPDLDVEALTWAQVIAIVHLLKAADGDMAALNSVYKQLEDSGASVVSSNVQVAGKDGTPLLSIKAARAIAANFDKRHNSQEEFARRSTVHRRGSGFENAAIGVVQIEIEKLGKTPDRSCRGGGVFIENRLGQVFAEESLVKLMTRGLERGVRSS